MIQVAVFGYGTVGSGVVEVIEGNKELIAKRAGEEIGVKYILDLREFPGDPYENKVVHDVDVILNDPEVQIVCETMGGLKVAYDYTKRALLKGKSVCTSNKELVAAYAPELLQIAKENKCSYFFEASVGGGIPIIRPLNEALTGEKIEQISGILNGTTNYILTKMEKEGADFDAVLKQAQDLGYAERNPEADIEGFDAVRKIAILSSLMTGEHVAYEKIYTEGITKVTADDFAYAKAMNMSIKLIAMSKATENGTLAMVSPCMVSNENPLYMVSDVFNAVCVTGNMLGDAMFYGKGAGKLPTASAVVGDVVEAAKHIGKNVACIWDAKEADLVDIQDVKRSFFIRCAKDAKADVTALFADAKEVAVAGRDDLGFVVSDMKEKDFAEKYAKLGDKAYGRIRLEIGK